MTISDRQDGERTRLAHSIPRLRAILDGLEVAMRGTYPIGTDVAQAVVEGALNVAMTIARHDAFEIAGRDGGA